MLAPSASYFMNKMILLRLMQDNSFDSALADWAEALGGIVTHTAYIHRTIDTLREVATTLVETYGVVLGTLWSDLCWGLDTVRNHICPLRFKVY